MTIHKAGRLAAVFLVLLLGVSLPPAVAQQPIAGGHFRRMLSSDPANLDPALTNTVRAVSVKMNIFDSLLRRDPKTLEITPGAAESWTVSEDRRTITFTLHRGIRFHHGREMTADDVKYTLERLVTALLRRIASARGG